MTHRPALLGLILALALPASAALANDPDASSQSATSANDAANEEANLKAEWQGRYRALLTAIESTSAELEADRRTYSKARQRGRLQGGVREDVVTRIANNERKLAELEQALEQFPDEARKAGVPPGWLREVAASPAP